MLLHVVADYGHNDLAFAEVAQRLTRELADAQLICTVVPPFATLAAGFCVAQLALNSGPDQMAVFHNVAPRRDDRGARSDNDGERLAYARLGNGRVVVGPNSGYAYSYLRSSAEEIRFVDVSSRGSQFRSRDIFAGAFARLISGDRELLGEEVPVEAIPAPPSSSVAYVDGYGNIKTTIDEADFEPGSKVVVTIAGVERQAVVAGGGFAVPDGVLAFSPGSSGWDRDDGGSKRFWELFLRGGNAWEAFGRPAPESAIQLSVNTA